MSELWHKLIEKLKRPQGWFLVITYVVTLAAIGLAMSMLLIDYEGTALEILAYVAFALAAVTLGYSVYTVILYAPGLKSNIMYFIDKYEFTRRIVSNFGFRTIVTAIGSFAMSIAYAVFNAVLGISSSSIWFGALAMYYILLAFMRGGLLLYHKNKKDGDTESEELIQAKNYRKCGVLLLILNFALSSAIAQMIFDDKSFSYPGWIIYAFAAYAFTKITMSIVNTFRATREDDMTIKAIRHINLVDAAVSILALQTALLHTFTAETENVSISGFNTATGSVVSLFSIGLSIYMIVKATRKIKSVKSNGQ